MPNHPDRKPRFKLGRHNIPIAWICAAQLFDLLAREAPGMAFRIAEHYEHMQLCLRAQYTSALSLPLPR
eukprot:1293137-Pleurochrysis_carterae.AAC.1